MLSNLLHPFTFHSTDSVTRTFKHMNIFVQTWWEKAEWWTAHRGLHLASDSLNEVSIPSLNSPALWKLPWVETDSHCLRCDNSIDEKCVYSTPNLTIWVLTVVNMNTISVLLNAVQALIVDKIYGGMTHIINSWFRSRQTAEYLLESTLEGLFVIFN